MKAITLIIVAFSVASAGCKTTLRKYEITNGIDTCKWENLYMVCEDKFSISHKFSNFIFEGNCEPFKKPMRGILVSEEVISETTDEHSGEK